MSVDDTTFADGTAAAIAGVVTTIAPVAATAAAWEVGDAVLLA